MRILGAIGFFVVLLGIAVVRYQIDPFGVLDLATLVVLSLWLGYSAISLLLADDSSRAPLFTSFALGIGILALIAWVGARLGLPAAEVNLALLAIALALLVFRRRASRLPVENLLRAMLWLLPIAFVSVLLVNLTGLHFRSDGALVSHGLFGVDLPFLAGEIQGLRIFPTLHDLHQLAQPWAYHDAAYRILAVLTPGRTIETLTWIEPTFGYAVLLLSVYFVLGRITKNRLAALIAGILWLLSASSWGSDLTSYALSPSFVFGTIILLATIATIAEVVHNAPERLNSRLSILLLLLLIELSRFKLSTFLVIGIALGLCGILLFRQRRTLSIIFIAAPILAVLQLLLFSSPGSALMPTGDFIVGAPLVGYANHLATLLHVPVATITPVTTIGIAWRSFLLIPYGLFHIIRMMLLDPRMLLAMVGGIVMLRHNRNASERIVLQFLLVAIPVGLLLPVLYSPAWYPLALSFYAPLVSGQCAILIIGILVARMIEWRVGRMPSIAIVVVVLLSVFFGIRNVAEATRGPGAVVPGEIVEAMRALSNAHPLTAVVATRRSDLDPGDSLDDESWYWYAALSGHPVVSEGAKYGSLLGAVADVDSAKGLHPVPKAQALLAARRQLLDTIYESRDTAAVLDAARRAHVQYILETNYDASETLETDASKYAERFFHSPHVQIWKLR